MTDRELLELAARAADVRYDPAASKPHPTGAAFFGLWLLFDGEPPECARRYWNPLTDDSDEARLESKLSLSVIWLQDRVEIWDRAGRYLASEFYADHLGDRQKARRYAGSRAAAEIGAAALPSEGVK